MKPRPQRPAAPLLVTCALLALIPAVLSGCGQDPAPGSTGLPGTATGDGGTSGSPGAPPAPRCRPGPGASGRPTSIDQAVELVNSLPRPVTVTCFLESLDRPLLFAATWSTISLQPAAGWRSPRVFLLNDKLVMSVAVAGKGRDLLEFGEYVSADRTIKGEIAFPTTTDVPARDPYERIRSSGPVTGSTGTSCRFCHSNEEPMPHPSGATAYVSGAFRPAARTVVPLDDVRREHQQCNPATEPERCAFLGSLLDHGAVVETPFPPEVPTFFD